MSKLAEKPPTKEEQNPQETKLEDILSSIRGMIDDHKLDFDPNEDGPESSYYQNTNSDNKYQIADGASLNDGEEVLELNQIVSSDNSVLSSNPASNNRANHTGIATSENKYASGQNKNSQTNANKSGEILSEHAKMKSADLFNQFADQAKEAKYKSDRELDSLVHKLVRPMLKDWLDNNLPRLVENIVREELRRLAPEK